MTQTSDIEKLFRIHYVAMHRMAMLILHDEDAARDIVHDVFEALLQGGRMDVSPQYLMTSVRNRCLNYLRSLTAKERFSELYALDEHEIEAERWPDDETIELIHSTVANDLTEACRRVVEMRFINGKSYKETAFILGISEVAVYKHLRHAIDLLRQKLSQNG
ncbi:MAG: sigma-70 family RNA polymerase sigma factor [Duncaniella sp.]|nr:sigma-70 family RNA polymerase sigma factor [Muribaculum sp.]MCM1254596.1 sigma-70 family RNA polymerase sigma factor [Duncaniella sp.]